MNSLAFAFSALYYNNADRMLKIDFEDTKIINDFIIERLVFWVVSLISNENIVKIKPIKKIK
jgi:hypothetical protein